ncbi:MAG TPA: DUF2723 domain-containing protein [Chitinophagales bacterium]|nr:DUF2723 domain-containing protein [Chitinophagales bacterium]
MSFDTFKHVNNIAGWLVFLFAASVYALTMEATASLWDCGEFIASVYKQQVVHPPGAQMFLMIARVFNIFSLGNPALVSLSLNFMSALCSGFAILFLFWITTHMARKLLGAEGKNDIPSEKVFAIIGAGLIAGLSGTFLDSIWFSATEAEVYSMSLMWTAMVFWGIIKWENRADEPSGDRWLLFVAFAIGTSIFVHWLNLLCIPAMTMIYYFKRYKATPKGAWIAFGVGLLIVGVILKLVITGLIDVASGMELFLVNSLGLPFNSGLVLFLALFLGGFGYGIYYTQQKRMYGLNSLMLGLMFILIGYTAIVATVIRSNSHPNIDMNSPRDLVSLASYLKREQYGSRPFLYGQYYTAEVSDIKETGTKYQRGKDRYDEVGKKIDYEYKGKKTIFPRLYDISPQFKPDYERWLGHKREPTFADNIGFFLNYQIGHMYMRYLMWNFAGRQNDNQGMGGRKDGNWLSGIGFIDDIRLGNQSNLPAHWKNIDARTTFYFLPLLLGLLGLVFQFTNNRRSALVILMLFFFTGMAIIIQGNSPPVEPRERDYIFAGSFWAFAIWVGLGSLAIYDLLKEKLNGKTAAIAATGLCLVVPFVLGFQGWDAHNRNNRFAARDFAANYLNSCAPNAIIFTQGDNDTYPLWYAQEVENIRRDVRVVNLSLLGVDWYINQLRRKVNDADPVPMMLDSTKIRGSSRDVVYYNPNSRAAEGQHYPLQDVIKFIGDDALSLAQKDMNTYPTKNFALKVDKQSVLASNAIAPEDQNKMADELKWTINKNGLYKNDLMTLDIIAANNWKRPIYFAISVSPESYLGLEKYFQLEGLAYRLVPIEVQPSIDPLTGKPDRSQRGRVNPDIMYDNLMNKFKFGNLADENVHTDSDLRRMVYNFRGNYSRLAMALIEQRGDKKRAIEVLDKCQAGYPDKAAPFDFYSYTIVEAYYMADAFDKANALAETIADRMVEELKYISKLPKRDQGIYEQELQLNEYFIRRIAAVAKMKGQDEFSRKMESKIEGMF